MKKALLQIYLNMIKSGCWAINPVVGIIPVFTARHKFYVRLETENKSQYDNQDLLCSTFLRHVRH